MRRPGGEPGHAASAGCPTAEEVALLSQWNAVFGGFRRLTDQLLDDVEAKAGVAPSSFQVLWFLLTAPDRSAPMNQLAQALGFSTAGTTKVADRLAEAGLIERRPSATDRRMIFATLTEAGRGVASAAALALADAVQDRIVGRLGSERFATLASIVGALDQPTDDRVADEP
jgi:DNA-binding MarR family transcriptional regulator